MPYFAVLDGLSRTGGFGYAKTFKGPSPQADLIAKTLQVRLEAYHVDTPEPLHFCDGPSGRGVAAAG